VFSGNEIGPFKAIEESTISQLVPSSERSSVLAWYILFGTAGTAGGTMLCGWTTQSLQVHLGWTPLESYRVVFWAYAFIGLVKFGLSLSLSPAAEQGSRKTPVVKPATTTNNDNGETRPLLADQHSGSPTTPTSLPEDHSPAAKKTPSSFPTKLTSLLPTLTPESLTLVLKLCPLFALDSIASGLTPASWLTYWLYHKFGLAEGSLGTLFFSINILSSASNLVASSIARRIGLIKTMVLTHIPASVALTLLPFPSSVGVVIALLIFRACTNSMDQAPRQAFLAAAVLPEERTAVMGLVNVVKTLSQSLGPVVTGTLAGRGRFWVAFVVAGALKLGYDVLMLGMFLGYRTQEERAEGRVGNVLEDEREEGRGVDRNMD
jgi:predicted MFS family arabinose efflux permease